MKGLVALLLCGLATGAAAADGQCNRGKAGVLTLADWKIEPAGPEIADVRVTLTNQTGKEIRLIKGTVWFKDALESAASGVPIEPDALRPVGGSNSQTKTLAGLARYGRIARQDVMTTVCVESAVYADGTRATFP
ncbi:hypothetical protein ACSD7O_14040 [Methylorubrum extorquens]|uniref:hypothetical protein n=1 Tax=Methylorubrum extorquens TaxID=408 RepID=UPI003F6061F9